MLGNKLKTGGFDDENKKTHRKVKKKHTHTHNPAAKAAAAAASTEPSRLSHNEYFSWLNTFTKH